MEFLLSNYFYICICFRWSIYFQFAILSIIRIASCPKANCPRIFYLFQWYVLCNPKAAATRMPIYGSASSKYVSCRLYVRTRLTSTWCIISMVAFSCEFPGESGFVLIPYSCSTKLLLNSRPRNYPHRSNVISTGHRYRTGHLVSTKFTTVIDFLYLHGVI